MVMGADERHFGGVVMPQGEASVDGIVALQSRRKNSTVCTRSGNGVKLVATKRTGIDCLLVAEPTGKQNEWKCDVWCARESQDISMSNLALETAKATSDPVYSEVVDIMEQADGRAFVLGMTVDGITLWIFGEVIRKAESRFPLLSIDA